MPHQQPTTVGNSRLSNEETPNAARPSRRTRPGRSDDETARLTSDAHPGLVIRLLKASDAPELKRIHATPEVARWWDVPAAGFPLIDAPEATRLTIEVDGIVAGLIQYFEEQDPNYRHAAIDLFLDPALHGRGLGTDALRRVVLHLIDDRGHHRITIDPAATNTAAIRSYEKAGFKRVGVMRQYERNVGAAGWHDGLLMELLADDSRAQDTDRPAATPTRRAPRAAGRPNQGQASP
jgi:aminoglycoside 6'-N-acetyltransferase